MADVDGVLITHGHDDHLHPEVVRESLARGVPVWAPMDACERLGANDGLHAVAAGDAFTIGAMRVQATGDCHAGVHPRIAGPENRAYLIAETVFVTGDAHPTPPGRHRLLVTPIDASWLRATNLIRYVQRLRPTRVLGVHDGLLNADGMRVARQVAGSLERNGAGRATMLDDGDSIVVEA